MDVTLPVTTLTTLTVSDSVIAHNVRGPDWTPYTNDACRWLTALCPPLVVRLCMSWGCARDLYICDPAGQFHWRWRKLRPHHP